MKKFAVLALLSLTLCSPARAGIMADLNSMFMSNSTAPGTFTSRDRVVGASAKGMFSDLTAGLKSFNTNAAQYFQQQGQVNPRVGNQVAKAIVSSGSSSVLGVIGLSNIDGSADDSSSPNSLNNRV